MNKGSGVAVVASSDLATRCAMRTGKRAVLLRPLRASGLGRASLLVGLAASAAVLLATGLMTPPPSGPPTLYATIETLLTLFGLAVAWLIRGRFLQTRRPRDLLLGAAVFAFGLVHLIACAIPAALNLFPRGLLAVTALFGELFAAAMIAAAAFAPADPLVRGPRRPDKFLLTVGVGSVALAAGAAVLLKDAVLGVEYPPGSPAVAQLLAVASIVATGGLLVAAALGFARDAGAGGKGDLLLAGAVILLAAASLSQLNGSLTDADSPADALRILGLALIISPAVRWHLRARRMAATAAAIAERQRIARDLHDGLAQDLAFIAAHSGQIVTGIGPEHPVVTAARRALQISRAAIVELSDPGAASAHEVLEAIAAELRRRFEITITLDVQLTHEVSPEVREHLSRIAREAIANAARHGDAETVAVSLHEVEGRVRLRVRDDGCGIDAGSGDRPREGFGLRSIRERAADLGGYVTLSRPHPHGTVLEVVL